MVRIIPQTVHQKALFRWDALKAQAVSGSKRILSCFLSSWFTLTPSIIAARARSARSMSS